MQPNNSFSLKRFGLYFRKDILDNYKMYLLFAGSMLAGACLLGFLFAFKWTMNDQNIHLSHMVPLYMVATLFFTGLVTARSFSNLGQQEQRIDFFMIPASILEKVLTRFVISLITIFIFLNLAIYIGFQVFEFVVTNLRAGKVIHDVPLFFDGPFGITELLIIVLTLHAIFFLGSTLFYKFSFPKIFFGFSVLLFCFWLINVLFTNILFGSKMFEWYSSIPYFMVMTQRQLPAEVGHMGMNTFLIPEWVGRVLIFTGRYLLIPSMWALAYFRIKDKEVQ
ncbi:hypothetical protein ACE38W_09155 [Chitinophaga sp. Hz27]|uniref:hypothetical protein n=1 Tax=Chitinophaga sp. Hz27 TaxID=3347169 RepID=UPI0035E24C70